MLTSWAWTDRLALRAQPVVRCRPALVGRPPAIGGGTISLPTPSTKTVFCDPAMPCSGRMSEIGNAASDTTDASLRTSSWRPAHGSGRFAQSASLAPFDARVARRGDRWRKPELHRCLGHSILARDLHDDTVRPRLHGKLTALAAEASGSTQRVLRFAFLTEKLSIDTGELTDKGVVSQRNTLRRHAALIEKRSSFFKLKPASRRRQSRSAALKIQQDRAADGVRAALTPSRSRPGGEEAARPQNNLLLR